MDFLVFEQDWMSKSNEISVTHIEVASKDGSCHCRLSLYPNENVQVLSNVYVNPLRRNEGICSRMLDYVDSKLARRKFTLVYVDSYAPNYIREMYSKRGYVILNND